MARVLLKYPDGTTGVRYSKERFRREEEKITAPVAIDWECVDELSLSEMNDLLSLMKAGSEGSNNLMELMEVKETELDILSTIATSKERMAEVADEEEELLERAEFNLDLALDTYDPTFPGYEISADAFEFFSLMRLVAGEDFEFDTPKAHYFMVDMLLGYITDTNQFPYSKEICDTIEIDKLFIGFMASRGVAKSTVVISFFGVYSAIKGELPNGIGKVYFYLLLAASTKGGARVNALAVRAMCEDSEYLKEYFEEMRFTETESEFVRRGDGPKKNRSFLLRYQGINTGVRGSRYGERRVCALIFDDAILNTAAAYSKVMSENLDEIIHSDATNALKGGGKGRVMLCFTPFSYSDVNTKAILQGAFTPVIIPMAKMFDAEKPLKAADIESTWEAMHPAVSIAALARKAKKTKKLKLFMQERMLRLTSGSDRLVPDRAIQFCDMKPIVNNLDYYSIYITTDFTTTSGEESDYSGRATWAVSNNEDWFMLDLALRKMTMSEQYKGTLDEAARYKKKGKNVELGVEVDGNQQAHIHSLEKEMMTRGDWYSFAKPKGDPYSNRKGILSKNTGVNKHERFRIAVNSVLLPQKMWFPEHLKNTPDMIEFIAQVKGATHQNFTRADDGPDLITMAAVSMNVIYPTEMGNPIVAPKNGMTVEDPFWGDDSDEFGEITGYSSYN